MVGRVVDEVFANAGLSSMTIGDNDITIAAIISVKPSFNPDKVTL
jgi:hypothetical protein